MTSRRPSGTARGSAGGSAFNTAEAVSTGVVRRNGGVPAAISKSSTPNDQISDLESAVSPRSTSGAM